MENQAESGMLLYGVKAIADFLGLPEKVCRHRVEREEIPTFKMGGRVLARRERLTEWAANLEAASTRKRAVGE